MPENIFGIFGKPATFCLKLEISWHMTRYLKGNTHSGSTEYAVEEPINDNMFGGKMSLLPLLTL